MNKSKMSIGLIAGAILGLLLLIGTSLRYMNLEEEVLKGLVFTYEEENETINFSIWEDDVDGRYYLFLPSWFSGKAGKFSVHYSDIASKVLIDGTVYKDGEYWVDEGEEKIHSLDVCGMMGAESVHTSLQVLSSENLPALFITVEEKDEILGAVDTTDKKYFETGFMQMLDENGVLLYKGELEKFKVRGNLTATLEKKPFTFTLKEPTGLLGMDSAVKWNLLANATDGAYIRNKIIMDLAVECIDAYEPQGEFAELYLNGEFQGIYLLTETVEIGPNRLEIDPEENWFIETELSFRARDDATQMITDRGQVFIIHSDSAVTEEEKEQLLGRLNDVESALFSENGVSSISGRTLGELIDMDSFAQAWLVEELSGDHDVGITSQFAYALKEGEALWYAGPVWDFDGTMGNVNKPMFAVPEALTGVVEMIGTEEDVDQNRWLSAMWRHSEFQELVKDKYIQIFRGKYEEILTEGIERYVGVIRRSAVLDTFRWHSNRLEWFFTLPEGLSAQQEDSYEKYDTLDTCLAVVEDFMKRKMDFLDKLWIEGREFCLVELRNSAPFLDHGYNQTLYYWVEKGTGIQNLPCYEEDGWHFEGYYDKDYDDLITDGFVIEYYRIAEGRWTQVEE